MEKIKNILEFLAKIGLPTGAAFIWLYAIKINYFPKGITIGDSLSLLILALTTSALLLAYAIATIIGSLSAIQLFSVVAENHKKGKSIFSIFKPSLSINLYDHFCITILSYTGIYSLCAGDIIAFILTAAIGTTASILIKNKYLPNPDAIGNIELDKKKNESAHRNFLILLIIISAYFSTRSDAFFHLLKYGTRIIHLREEAATIYTKTPYSDIISKHIEPTGKIGEFKEFKNITILFNGIGSMTVISLDNKDGGAILEIPKEQITISNTAAAKTK